MKGQLATGEGLPVDSLTTLAHVRFVFRVSRYLGVAGLGDHHVGDQVPDGVPPREHRNPEDGRRDAHDDPQRAQTPEELASEGRDPQDAAHERRRQQSHACRGGGGGGGACGSVHRQPEEPRPERHRRPPRHGPARGSFRVLESKVDYPRPSIGIEATPLGLIKPRVGRFRVQTVGINTDVKPLLSHSNTGELSSQSVR
eukprot:874110-Prorocentrum_minimum.AAC.2